MTSVGVMASAVVTGVCTSVLREPFDNLAVWSSGSLVAGRNGTALNISGSSASNYAVPAPNQSPYVTLGLAYKVSQVGAAIRSIVSLRDNTGGAGSGNDLLTLDVELNGSIGLRFGGAGAALLGTSGAGLIVAATWNYIELQVFLADVGGSYTVRVNNTVVISATNVDTIPVGTWSGGMGNLFIRGAGSGQNQQIDDLYLTTGSGCAFQGDQVIPTSGTVILNDPANNFTFAPWTTAGTVAITASGNTGNGFSIPVGTGNTVSYDIPAPSQSAKITVSFWLRFTGGSPGQQTFMTLRSDAGVTQHIEMKWDSGGFIGGYTTGGLQLGSLSAAGAVPINTWCFIEFTCVMGDVPNGYFQLKVNGAFAFTPPAIGVDTKNAGTKAVFDQIRFNGLGTSGLTYAIDDISVRIP